MPSAKSETATQRLVQRYRDLPLEEVACYLCGHREGALLVDDPPFRVLSCANCHFGYTTPRIDDSRIHEIYGDAYFNSESADAYGYTSYAEDESGYLKTFAKKARIIQRLQPKGRLLEIGCAAGFFLKVMQDLGYEVHGSEIAEATLARARDRFGIKNLYSGPLQDLQFPKQHFDIIAMFDVIEHVPDPIGFLKVVKELLAPKGLLVLQTQDVDSLARKVLKEKWHHFKQLEHIYHFSPRTLPTLLTRSGFELVQLQKRGAGKYISFQFLHDRLHHRWGIPSLLLKPLLPFKRQFIYVNPFDELLAFARIQES